MDLQSKPSAAPSVPDESSPKGELADGRYVVWRKLGSGAQAETLAGVDRKDGRPVAIKRFYVGHARSWKDVELAEREARVLQSPNHPALPAYVDHFEEQGALYLVMELVEGDSLATINKSGKRLGQGELRDLVYALAEVLEYLPKRGTAPAPSWPRRHGIFGALNRSCYGVVTIDANGTSVADYAIGTRWAQLACDKR